MRLRRSTTLGHVLGLLAGVAGSVAGAQELVGDAKSQPESLAAVPGGGLIVGSASSPLLYHLGPGATTATKWVDAGADGAGTFFLGVLADPANGMLWACELMPVPNTTPVKRRTFLRGFALSSVAAATGEPKFRWQLPGETTTCNDMTVGPDRALYVTDTAQGRIYRLLPGGATPELFLENRVLNGVDGITFLGSELYVNNVVFNKLYRIPVDAAGKPGTPVDIWMDAPVKGPDGMRAAGDRMFVAENGGGRIDMLSVTGDRAHVTVLKEGLKTPTAVEPSGETLWVAERGAGQAVPLSMPK